MFQFKYGQVDMEYWPGIMEGCSGYAQFQLFLKLLPRFYENI